MTFAGWVALAGMRVAGYVVPWMPLPLLRSAADVAGAAGYTLGTAARRGGATNLAAAVDPADPDLLALRLREAFRTQAQNYVDLFRIPALPIEAFGDLVDMKGWEHVVAARAAGRGAVLAAAHLGNIDLVVQHVCARG